MSANLILTQIYLEPAQKRALQRQAKAHGTHVAEEVRRSVDAYLAGVTSEQLELLDAATLTACKQLDAMSVDLDRINARLEQALTGIERLRPGRKPRGKTAR